MIRRVALGLCCCVAAGCGAGTHAVRAGSSCPAAVQPLPAAALAGAVHAALRQAPRIYRSVDLKGMRATEAVVADDSRDRGGYAGRHCGRRVQHRTVVVYLDFPALRTASLREGVVLVSRVHGRYRVWARLH
jgi:hypothetical protein